MKTIVTCCYKVVKKEALVLSRKKNRLYACEGLKKEERKRKTRVGGIAVL